MKFERIFRYSVLLLALALIAASLGACKLPASQGPAVATEDFPLPGETELVPDFGAAATATAQAQAIPTLPPLIIVRETPTLPVFTATPVPQVLQPTPAQVVPPAGSPPQLLPTYVQPTPGIPATYTLQAGEFPFCIARRFNVNQYELLALNGLSLSSQVRPGLTLIIPQTGRPFEGNPTLLDHPTVYTVKAGDTIFSIACAFGDVSPDLIILQNGLEPPYELEVGQKLTIP